jgi:hypothetical protein
MNMAYPAKARAAQVAASVAVIVAKAPQHTSIAVT